MDPSANLAHQLDLARRVLAVRDRPGNTSPSLLEFAAVELAELVLALDEWRLSGGFDPYAPTDAPTDG